MVFELAGLRDAQAPVLRPILSSLLAKIAELRASDLPNKLSYPINLFGLTYPWIVELADANYDGGTDKQVISETGFDGAVVVEQLRQLLLADAHLRACCLNEFMLAKSFDLFFDIVLERSNNLVPTTSEFEEYFEKFLDYLYDRPFESISFSHLYNFDTEIDNLTFGSFDLTRLDGLRLAKLLGTYPPSPFPHPYSSGDYFIVFRESEVITDDARWLFDKWVEAENIARVLQYYKDGIVHINYTVQYFQPEWVNRIRKTSFFPIGQLRRFPYRQGEQMYTLNEAELGEVAVWFKMFEEPKIAKLFGDERNNLGKTLEAAGSYYESSHTHDETSRQLIDLAISLEAIFSPYNQNEISFQLSQLAGQFVGHTVREKQEIFDDIRNLYKKRSKLFHGSYDAHKDAFVSNEEIENWSSILRQSLLKFIALYIRGHQNHKTIIEDIRKSLFDPTIRRQLRKESDPKILVSEYQANPDVINDWLPD